MTPNHEFEHLLQRHKFKLVDDRREYRRYRSPEGRILVTTKHPSDLRTWQRMLADIKRVIAAPVPIVGVLEAERQQQLIETFVQISAQTPKTVGQPGASRSPRPSGTGTNSGTGYGYIVKVLPLLTDADIELSKQAVAHDKLVHAANKDIRALRHDFSNTVAGEGRAWLERNIWKIAQRQYAREVARFRPSAPTARFQTECYTLQEGFDILLADELKSFMPPLMESTRKLTMQFGFELDATTKRGWRRRFPNIIRETLVPEQGIYIPEIYRRWLKTIVPPEDWAYFEERAEEPDAAWTQQVLAHTQSAVLA